MFEVTRIWSSRITKFCALLLKVCERARNTLFPPKLPAQLSIFATWCSCPAGFPIEHLCNLMLMSSWIPDWTSMQLDAHVQLNSVGYGLGVLPYFVGTMKGLVLSEVGRLKVFFLCIEENCQKTNSSWCSFC